METQSRLSFQPTSLRPEIGSPATDRASQDRPIALSAGLRLAVQGEADGQRQRVSVSAAEQLTLWQVIKAAVVARL